MEAQKEGDINFGEIRELFVKEMTFSLGTEGQEGF